MGRTDTADVWLDAMGPKCQVIEGVDALLAERLKPFEANLRTGRRAPRRQQAVLVDPDPTWPGQAARLIRRLRDAVGWFPVSIDHIGSTSVPGLAAKELLGRPVNINIRPEDKMPWIRAALGRAERRGSTATYRSDR